MNSNSLDILSRIAKDAYNNNLIKLIIENQHNIELLQDYCKILINNNKDNESTIKLVDYFYDKFKHELFETFCWAIIKHNNNIYCLDKLAYYYLEINNYINAFNCYIGIIIKSQIDSLNITKCIDIFNNIFVIIKMDMGSNLIFTQLLTNIQILNSDIPPTHKNIFDQIVKSIKIHIG